MEYDPHLSAQHRLAFWHPHLELALLSDFCAAIATNYDRMPLTVRDSTIACRRRGGYSIVKFLNGEPRPVMGLPARGRVHGVSKKTAFSWGFPGLIWSTRVQLIDLLLPDVYLNGRQVHLLYSGQGRAGPKIAPLGRI